MQKKQLAITVTTLLSVLCLCAVALLLCNRGKTSGTQDGLSEDYTFVYDEVLDLSLPIMEDWIIVGEGIERTQTDYVKLGGESPEQCVEELKNYGVYSQTLTSDFSCVYQLRDLFDITSESYSKLSQEERQKADNSILEVYKEENASIESTEYCTINNTVWFHAVIECEPSIVELYIGTINNQAINTQFMYNAKNSNGFNPATIMNKLTVGQVAPPSTPTNTNFLQQLKKTVQMNNLPLWVFGAILLCILLYGVKFAKPKEFFEDSLSLKVAKGIQGFSALGIVLHHLVQKLAGADLTGISYFENIGVLFVGIFFFFSGFGLFVSYKTKENYLHGFLRKRLPILLLPFFISSWMYILVKYMTGERIESKKLIQFLTGFKLSNSNSWYVIELLVLYLVFYLTFRFIRNKNVAYAINGLFALALVVVSLLLGHSERGEDWFMGEWWFNSTLLFFVGMSYAKFRHKLLPLIKRFYWFLLPGFVAGFGILYHFTTKKISSGGYWTETETSMAYMDKFSTLVVQLPMIIFFIVALLLISMKVQFGNRFVRFIGTFTLELYLVQNLFIGCMKDVGIIRNNPQFVLAVFVLSIITGWALHRLCRNILNLFQRLGSKSQQDASLTTKVTIHSRNNYIDVFRLIMCFLVVCIHIPFPGQVGDIIITYGKTAVPFFITVSGYLSYREDSQTFSSRLKKQGARLLSLAVWANFLYALVFFLRNGADAFNSLITDESLYNLIFLNESPFASHLWFLGSLAFAIGIMLFLNKINVTSKVIYAFPLLLAIYFISWRKDGNMTYMLQYRNAIACTLSYFMAGCVLSKHQTWIKQHIKPAVAIIASSLLFSVVTVEYILCKNIAIPYISTELLTFALVLFCIVCNKEPKDVYQDSKYVKASSLSPYALGRNCSLNIYIFHVAFISILMTFLGKENRLLTDIGPILVFIITLVFTYAISFVQKITISNK